VQAKLFRIVGAKREEIGELRPQVHQLLRYLLKRNRANNDVPVLCSQDELMEAIWHGEPLHTREELNGLIHELRQKVELDPSKPRFVQTVRRFGFRLDPRPSAD
jgi:DNA-binding winged helix-turn-helix (wHTH) protein